MDNFEARYRAIVEKDDRLVCSELYQGRIAKWRDSDTGQPVSAPIAREAVTLWLGKRFPKQYRFVIGPSESSVEEWHGAPLYEWRVVCSSTDHADAILTAWEIILGIKEGA